MFVKPEFDDLKHSKFIFKLKILHINVYQSLVKILHIPMYLCLLFVSLSLYLCFVFLVAESMIDIIGMVIIPKEAVLWSFFSTKAPFGLTYFKLMWAYLLP